MGTTAEKLTYLNTTKGKIKDSINLTGANIGSNDTFRSYAVKLRDGLLDIINNGTATLYNNFPKVSGTGSNINLSNTLEAPMFMNKFDGDTLQDGEPTLDTPVEIQSVEGIQNITISDGTDSDSYEVNLEGKNLWNNTQVVNTSDYIENNGTGFKLSKTANGRITPEYTILIPANTSIIITNILKNYTTSNGIIYCQWVATDNTIIWAPNINNTSITTSFNKDIKGVKFYLQTNETNGNYVEIENLMIRYASISDSEYVPYRSPIKLYNGDYITGTPNNWSIVRENGRVVLDGSENWNFENSSTTPTNRTIINYAATYNNKNENYISNRFIKGSTTSNRFIMYTGTYTLKYLSIDDSTAGITSSDTNTQKVNKIKTWLSNNNTEVIYELAEPTTEPITDTYLISQLNALYNAKSYNGQTNISVSGNLPMILEVSALKDEI